MKLKYNLQYFANGDNNGDSNSNADSNNGSTGNDNNDTSGVNNDTNDDDTPPDISAFADLLSEKDKELEQLRTEVEKLKKSNAELIVKVSAGTKQTQKTFDENLLALVGAKPRKE